MEAKRRCESIQYSRNARPVLNYGLSAPRSGMRLPIGGEIKYLHLRTRFPEHRQDFNLIYLVSSALPPHVVEVVRAAQARGAKLVWNQNGIAYPGFYGDFYPWFNQTMAALLPMADHVIYQSAFCRDSADRYLGIARGSSEILFNPVDSEKFCPRENLLATSTWELLCAGTNHSFYRVDSPLKAVKILRDRGHPVRLTIAGEFRWRDGDKEFNRAVRKLGLETCVVHKPPFSQDKAPEIYRGAHLLLHGKDKDPCPTVPIEAMACGLPVVGLASGGMPELVAPTTGCLVPVPQIWTEDCAADPVALADAVEKVMSDLGSFAQSARRHAQKTFDVRPWLDRHQAIFTEVLSR